MRVRPCCPEREIVTVNAVPPPWPNPEGAVTIFIHTEADGFGGVSFCPFCGKRFEVVASQ